MSPLFCLWNGQAPERYADGVTKLKKDKYHDVMLVAFFIVQTLTAHLSARLFIPAPSARV
jgi:hypothetical protein